MPAPVLLVLGLFSLGIWSIGMSLCVGTSVKVTWRWHAWLLASVLLCTWLLVSASTPDEIASQYDYTVVNIAMSNGTLQQVIVLPSGNHVNVNYRFGCSFTTGSKIRHTKYRNLYYGVSYWHPDRDTFTIVND